MNLLRLLTVDDEAHIHDGLDSIMDWESLGFEHVAAAMNGHEALDLARTHLPDVVLTDIRMPGMDGLGLIRNLRALPDLDPAIIVVSGYDDFEYARAAMRYRVRDYLLKPIDEDELGSILREIRTRAEHAQKHSISGESPPSGAVIRLLGGSRNEPVVAAAAEAVAIAPGECLLPLIVVGLVSDLSFADPLSAVTVRDALGPTKARATRHWVVDNGPLSVVQLCRLKTTGDEALRLWVRGLARSLQDALARHLVIHYGPAVAHVAELPEALVRLRDAISGSPPPDCAGVVGHVEIETHRSTRSPGVSSVIDAIDDADEGGAIDALEAVVAEWRLARVSARAIRDWMSRLRLQIHELLIELGASPRDVPSDDAMRTAARLAEYLPTGVTASVAREFTREAVRAILRCRTDSRHSIVTLIKRRIDRHYADELTLGDIASAYSMNAAYLGQLFRKVVGVGFREYLRSRRVREAQRLLRDTDLHIPEVARTVGYRDADFFADQFKRETGATPAAFRASSRA